MIKVQRKDLSALCNQQICRKGNTIRASPEHVLNGEFSFLPFQQTSNYLESFIPTAMRHVVICLKLGCSLSCVLLRLVNELHLFVCLFCFFPEAALNELPIVG